MTISTNPLTAVLFVCASAVCGTWGCVSNSKDDATGGSSGTGTGGSSASGGSGNSTGGSNAGGDNGAVACPTPTAALITDFSMPDPMNSTKVIFTGPPGGGTYHYPAPTDTPAPMFPLESDATMGNLHVSGMVGTYSGFGLYFDNCSKVDASAFKGIRFKISGTVAMGDTMTVTVGTAATDVASSWLNAHKAAGAADVAPNFSRCMPASAQYDGTCEAAKKQFPVTATPTTVTVLWGDLTGGKPAGAVDPSELVTIAWAFPNPPGAGSATATPYMADVTIDDLEFVP